MSDVDVTTVITIIVVLFGREAGVRAIKGLRDARSGRIAEEKTRVAELIRDADHEAEWRRQLQEYASELRRIYIERCGTSDELPPFPREPER